MAHPIYSFVDPKTKYRYYQVWDTYEGYPSTIPMLLPTFLQYDAKKRKKYIEVLHAVYHQLINSGCTLLSESEITAEDELFTQAFEFIAIDAQIHDPEEIRLSNELESLFLADLDFETFYARYCECTANMALFPRRLPVYYESWSRTSAAISLAGNIPMSGYSLIFLNEWQHDEHTPLTTMQQITDEVFLHYQLHLPIDDAADNPKEKYNFDSWYKAGFFTHQRPAMEKLFFLLASNNLIPAHAIPHILRGNVEIRALFEQLGMEQQLPDFKVQYDLMKPSSFKPVKLNERKYRLQYTHLFVTDWLNNEEPGKGFNMKELARLYDLDSEYPVTCFNFIDNYGNLLLPMKFPCNHMIVNKDTYVLEYYGFQYNYYIFAGNGYLIDHARYSDIFPVAPYLYYMLEMDGHGNSLIRWSYKPEENLLIKEPASLHMAFDSIFDVDFQEVEAWYQNQPRQQNSPPFKILSILLMNGRIDLFVADNIETIRINHYAKTALKNLLKKGESIDNDEAMALEIFKEFVIYNYDFYYCRFHELKIMFKNNHTTVTIDEHHQADKYLSLAKREALFLRPRRMMFKLILSDEEQNADQTQVLFFHYKDSIQTITGAIEDYLSQQGTNNHNMASVSSTLKQHLNAKGFDSAEYYTLLLNHQTVSEITGYKLDENQNFIIPPESASDDDLPF